jgi:hypothetical protein
MQFLVEITSSAHFWVHTRHAHPCCNIFYYLLGISKAKGKLKSDHSIFWANGQKDSTPFAPHSLVQQRGFIDSIWLTYPLIVNFKL